jgi:hypothetical protein
VTVIARDEAPIGKAHDRTAFDLRRCRFEYLSTKIRAPELRKRRREVLRRAPANAPARILGFCTVSPSSLEYARTSALAKKGLAHYDVPVFARLAVDRRRKVAARAALWGVAPCQIHTGAGRYKMPSQRKHTTLASERFGNGDF